tara:strand:+ start:6541 stop:7575 length:1035 start_codon:yes stop_codon:yes gene_type:complete
MLWQERYRPKTLDEVVGQDHIVPRLKYMVDELHRTGSDAGMPHLLFAGPPGTGKTTCAVAFMRSAFGEDWNANWLELNASDARSINDIRGQVKDFARRGVIGTYKVDPKYGDIVRPIPFNVVFLDEADNLTPDAQSSLRRIIEQFSKQTRFIISCNYPHKIIEPVRDRCAFADSRFRPIPSSQCSAALSSIVSDNGLQITDPALDLIAESSKGSMRKAVNLLFSVTRIPGMADVEDVLDLTNTLTPKRRRQLLNLAVKASRAKTGADYKEAHRRIDRFVEDLSQRGMHGGEILHEFYLGVEADEEMPAKVQRAVLSSIGEALYFASVSQDDILQVKTFLRGVTL